MSPPSSSPFLALPSSVRETIYSHLLASHPSDPITTINYTLSWPWLENPSNTTFTGLQQIDLCRCPRTHKPRTRNSPTTDHMYIRHKCVGPEVCFKSGREDLWVLDEGMGGRGGMINLLRPARRDEIPRRLDLSILLACWSIYQEAVPILYEGRNFLFLSGPCPRGRYQAYASKVFFSRLSPFARSRITCLSLIAQSYEEDCADGEVGQAYADLASYIRESMPAFSTLCLNLWDRRLADAVAGLGGLFDRGGMRIYLAEDPITGAMKECRDLEGFLEILGVGGRSEYKGKGKVVMKGDEVAETEGKKRNAKDKRKHKSKRAEPVWEEVQDDESVPALQEQNVSTGGAGTIWEEVDEVDDDGETSQEKPSVRKELRLRKVSKVQKVLSRTRRKSNLTQSAKVQEEEGDDEWVDAVLSPATESGEMGSWEVV